MGFLIVTGMGKLFISHSSQDDGVVRELQQALGDLQQDAWIDSRELRGGDLLWTEVQAAIEAASAYAVLVSPDALQSEWVGDELAHALEIQKQRGKDQYPVIPLSLNGTKLGVLNRLFGEAPAYIPISSEAGGVEAALDAILVALRIRLPADRPATPQPKAEALEELVLELTDLKIYEQDGIRRAQAKARLVYEPATPGQREVASEKSWRFIAPIGPIEAEELRWYLEKYAIWPSRHFDDRAAKVKQSLVEWGRLLYQAALPVAHTNNVLQAWAKIDSHAGRRFSVYVDKTLEADAPQAEEEAAREAATLLLGLPWELLHNEKSFLFQGAKPTRVRRRLPNTEPLDVAVVAPPIRILLVTARPEDESCGYIDHRASALALVDAMEALGGLVQIRLLDPPTLPALSQELARAREQRQPYHVVHFDGHGVYDRRVGLGGLCFEDPQDSAKLENRRHQTIYTDALGPLLSGHRIPLVFLEACQTAQAGQASESVASELLRAGVASVVAMSHSVLVETARRFVEAFYQALAAGRRVGDAMLAGQRVLKDDTFRGRVFGVGEFRLEDWFVPVLFQEKDDPQLFRATPARQTLEDGHAALKKRLGDMPPPPATGFIGRSRDLLALQRLLRQERYAVVRGQGGEGKTALAAEFARWMLRSQQCRRVAFVSVEMHSTAAAVLDALGRQLLPAYSVATFGDWDQAVQPVERALKEQATLLVLDNLESILLPPFLAEETSDLLVEDARSELGEILKLCERLLGGDCRAPFRALGGLKATLQADEGATRIVFTSRENLPAPFDGLRHRRELHRLDKDDAVKLVERALNAENPLPPGEGGAREEFDARTEAIEQLVGDVQGHARTLALLAPSLRKHGVEQTRASLLELLAEMERRYPGNREQSVYASVELSLRRLSPAAQERTRVLGVFQGGVQLGVLRLMMQWEDAEVAALAGELVETGLATPNRYNHLSLNPALCPYLLKALDREERQALAERWGGAMREYVNFLVQQDSQNAEMAATLTLLELPNLFALLEQARQTEQAEAIIDLAVSLYQLLQTLGKPRLLERLGRVREAAEAKLGEAWSHARFEAQRTRIEQQWVGGRLREAFDAAHALLRQARTAGETAYPGADYDLAGACWLLARVLPSARDAEHALPLLDEARLRFETIAKQRADKGAERMASVCLAERGDGLFFLGRLDEAAAAYEDAIHRAGQLGVERDVAVGKGQLGSVRYLQRRHPEALAAYAEARESFGRLGERGSVAIAWHQTGVVYQALGQPEAAEDAYLQSLALDVRLGDAAGPAGTLLQLGILYGDKGRAEDAVAFFGQAADRYGEIGDQAREGMARSNLAHVLRKLSRLAEARQQIRRAIDCKAQSGHASEPWKTWDILAGIESDDGQPAAAAEAKAQALRCYLAYRRDGGENHSDTGRLALDVAQALKAGEAAAAASLLQQLAADPELPNYARPFIEALQAIVAGSRDPGLADSADLDYTMAAEIRLLLETLEPPG